MSKSKEQPSDILNDKQARMSNMKPEPSALEDLRQVVKDHFLSHRVDVKIG